LISSDRTFDSVGRRLVRLAEPLGPGEEQLRPRRRRSYGIFRKEIQRRNVVAAVAVAAAQELP
jgi:hypothetical protein